ncbi:hypothetical protein AKJ40_04550, partial [candidate division MSBL1 archaeon SCGC-AAA259M10]
MSYLYAPRIFTKKLFIVKAYMLVRIMSWHITLEENSWEEARENFEWNIPKDYNVIHDLLRKHDDPKSSIALFQALPGTKNKKYTFHELDNLSNRLANGLSELNVGVGDRIAIMLSQRASNP